MQYKPMNKQNMLIIVVTWNLLEFFVDVISFYYEKVLFLAKIVTLTLGTL